jgi:flagellar assembly protein FliH/type III secretion protein L
VATSSRSGDAPATAPVACPEPVAAASVFGTWEPGALAGSRRRIGPGSRPASGDVTAWHGTLLDSRDGRPGGHGGTAAEGADDEADRAQLQSFEDGRRAGRAEAVATLEPAARALHEASLALGSAREEILHDLRCNVTALALAIAKRVVGREVAADSTIVGDLVARGLELVKPDSPVEIRLNPSDLDAVKAGLELRPGDETYIHWSADPELERGGFFIEGPRRIVDGRLDEAMRVLYERLAYE